MSTRPITFIQTTDDQQVSLNIGYVLFLGLMRILVVLLEVGCVLAAGFIPINQQLFFELNQQFVMIRTALIVIACIAIAFSIFIYFTSLLNIVNVVRAVPWLLIFLVIDCLTILTFIILGCFACNQEAQVPQNLYGIVYTRSLYAISGVLLFLASIILLIHSYFSLVYLYRLDKFFSQTGPFDQMWRFNKNYCSALGWVRVIILLFLTAALIASILINVNSFELYDTQATFYETRTASIILTATALAYSSFLFYASVCNCVNIRFCMAAPWLAIGILYDLIFLAAMITIGIFCAIKETQIPWYDYNFIFRRGAYSVAALFEFLSAIFYMIHIVLSLPYTYRVAGLPKKLSIISLFK